MENHIDTEGKQVEETTVEVENTQPENKKDDSVPLYKYLDTKNELKKKDEAIEALTKEIRDLAEAQKNSKQTPEEKKVEKSETLSDLSNKYGVDSEFLGELFAVVRKDIEKDVEERFKPLKEKEILEAQNKAFEKLYDTTIEKMPEYAQVVNKEVVRKLSRLSENQEKTLEEILEETYGTAIQTKPTIESTTPSGGKEPEKVDIKRAKNDTDYFKVVMANPELKRQYNDAMLNQRNF